MDHQPGKGDAAVLAAPPDRSKEEPDVAPKTTVPGDQLDRLKQLYTDQRDALDSPRNPQNVVTGLADWDDWLVSTVRYFGACPVCGRRERGGEITYDATAAEVATGEQTHGCCSTELLPPVLLIVAVYESATAAAANPTQLGSAWSRLTRHSPPGR